MISAGEGCRFVVVSVMVLVIGGGSALAQETPADKLHDDAIRLFDEHKYLDALPLLENVHSHNPDDLQIKEYLACSIASTSSVLKGEEQARGLIRARTMLKEVEAKRKLSNLGTLLLDLIPEDGVLRLREGKSPADDALLAGEAAFARRDFARALASYELAMTLNPRHYGAAVAAGDAWFAQGNMTEAIPWFSRAVDIDPNQAVAYRYWGDALMRQGKMDEACDKFILGIVAEPYSKAPWISLSQWGDVNKVTLSHPRILPPDPPKGQPREVATIDGTNHTLLYGQTRGAWKASLFKEAFPDEPEYRHTLREEIDALRKVEFALADSIQKGEIKERNQSLLNLLTLDSEGLLEACVLLSRPDQGIAQDYPAYREDHRDKLVEYLTRYVAHRQKPERPAADENKEVRKDP